MCVSISNVMAVSLQWHQIDHWIEGKKQNWVTVLSSYDVYFILLR